VDRGTSNTLWLRRMAVAFPTPYQPVANPFVTTVHTVKNRITMMRGDRWRIADLDAQILGGLASFSVAHALPSAA
jgi:hypothetical protein